MESRGDDGGLSYNEKLPISNMHQFECSWEIPGDISTREFGVLFEGNIRGKISVQNLTEWNIQVLLSQPCFIARDCIFLHSRWSHPKDGQYQPNFGVSL
ncbi:hypothetical protein JHK87_007452 [Glycine soja]|nr:hypothetical protein JHK87_007452 [Glycine soja]